MSRLLKKREKERLKRTEKRETARVQSGSPLKGVAKRRVRESEANVFALEEESKTRPTLWTGPPNAYDPRTFSLEQLLADGFEEIRWDGMCVTMPPFAHPAL